MNFGFVYPFNSPRQIVDWAIQAETAGWNGFFVSDLVWGVDAWMLLAAAAVQTERIRLGTMLTPMPWVTPWKLAGETVTLDHLSNGRAILAVGLGANDTGAGNFGMEIERGRKAALLDEGLDILTGLWRGQPFDYSGKRYTIRPTTFQAPPPPVQQPRIPIWVVGAWPRLKSMQRAIKYDGVLPMTVAADGKVGQAGPDDVRAIKAFVDRQRSASMPFDIVVEGQTSGKDRTAALATLTPWADSGATWWIESHWGKDEAAVLARLRRGPPAV